MVTKAEIDRKAAEIAARREKEGRAHKEKKDYLGRLKRAGESVVKKAGPALKHAAEQGATWYKENAGKRKSKGSIMASLNRMSTYDPFGSPRSRKKTAKKKSPRRRR